MTFEETKKLAIEKKFGPRALGILSAAKYSPVNPYDHFGHTLRRSWGYAYFRRLVNAGLLRQTETPEGRRGHHWYVLA